MKPVEGGEQNVYSWGEACTGWRLLELDHLQVRHEAMPPGTAEEPHMHRRAHQFFYVLAGRMTVRTPDGVSRVAPGQGIHVPAGQPHWVRNEDVVNLRFLLCSSPTTTGDRLTVTTSDWTAAVI
ncbi:cupin domain-containing protein [Acuticoccus sediminis]|uniref:Cupin domain-containing protein n=1 Tax=Acuticoccus sediminis TaxID=2184697 RepID=A0A8B2NLJ9_9HYPH|nr:cupin domain-containing protein [Acuticoccus sediminis]RAH96094.1 cupin domain-containing protein [Acuticoccus sediminis]